MARKHKKADLENLRFAKELVRHNARGAIIVYETGVSETIIQQLYRAVHGARPATGQLPPDFDVWLTRRKQYRITVLWFANALKRTIGNADFEDARIPVDQFLQAYNAYLTSWNSNAHYEPLLEISYAWALARDLHYNLSLANGVCHCCGGVSIWGNDPEHVCWVCQRAAATLKADPNPRHNRCTAKKA